MTDEAGQGLVNIMGACSFQDITGWRVNSVVKMIRYIHDWIVAMIGIWGTEALIDLPVKKEQPQNDGEAVLNGPVLGNEGLSDNDIDALIDCFLPRTRHRRCAVIYGNFVDGCSNLV